MAGNDRVQIEHLKQFFIRDITQMGHMVRTTEEEKTIDTIFGTVMVQFSEEVDRIRNDANLSSNGKWNHSVHQRKSIYSLVSMVTVSH